MKNRGGIPQFAIFEITGFLLVVLVIWLDEVVDLPYLLFHAPRTLVRYPEALLETILILIIGAGVVSSTLWLSGRVKQLESYIVMCAWCRKIKTDDGRWVTIEEYIWERDEREITHGLCETCAREQIELIKKSR